ncbi:hypothetical protein HYPSUDRAFT_44179 [Hypholoma sublateritium FD-334 SS-4]|uniref:Uncharacterized protein n=1 Tax=Hypholoma sublateritium (strain FD-334 SS-4) TaxID=945553 RepID=A0A0D2M8I9_HYPSF|nr:hypothetical protein HYPSUDRAFT_44179 [Hypholoma sublateritium FD-334 SS-4]
MTAGFHHSRWWLHHTPFTLTALTVRFMWVIAVINVDWFLRLDWGTWWHNTP